jgi:hypothetical protein
MIARAGDSGRAPSVGTLNEGRTDIDVMIVIATRREEIRKARTNADPGRPAQPPIHYDYSGTAIPEPQPG